MADTETTQTADMRGRRKTRIGVVSSDKMQKTVVVTVSTLVRHPIYGRTLRQSNKFKAHDENNDAHIGDTVEIMETRPLSKDKCWRVLRVVERAR
ncbi:MAG: 30S ribosomal protein S17 [Armatimonadetes bacterium]|nr:30S ribosomal protein S17 [Armatimonadota bacterium]